MDKRTRRYFGFGISVALLIALLFIGYMYINSKGLLSPFVSVSILIGTFLGIIASYFMYHSFFERE
ncbi:MAG: hypothetical protein V1703_02485, partial [Candidatus Altiarchaeota archaeon]